MTEFDPLSRAFHGLDRVTEPFDRYEFEANLTLTSYYHASKGGRGKLLEKLIALKAGERGTLNLKLSELPAYLEAPNIRSKLKPRGERLSREERELLNTLRSKWSWRGSPQEDLTIDLVNLRSDGTLAFLEVKNRVDSGGTAARRETLDKFGRLLRVAATNQTLYSDGQRQFSLTDLLAKFGVGKLRAISGFLYSPAGGPATLEDDERYGFVGESRRRISELSTEFQDQPDFSFDQDRMRLSFRFASVTYTLEAAYGDEITERFCDRPFPVAELLEAGYDDMWLALAVAVRERTMLKKLGINTITVLLRAVEEEDKVSDAMKRLIDSEGDDESALEIIVRSLDARLPEEVKERVVSEIGSLDGYLADVIFITTAFLAVGG